jgi:dCMP deaminase
MIKRLLKIFKFEKPKHNINKPINGVCIEIPDWDQLFMTMAHLIARKSKDTSTKTGSIIVDNMNRIKSLGYNGFPRGVDDSVEERYQRPTKYFYVTHSEANSILNYRGDLEGCKIYVTWSPCCECSKMIIQSGIKEVIIHEEFDNIDMDSRWDASTEAATTMLEEAGVEVRKWSGKVLDLSIGLKNGHIVDL